MPMPASRFIIAQSWWIASELVRRHPKLGLAETHPCSGMYDCLSLFATDGKHRTTLIDLNRVGSTHIHVNPDFEPLTWEEVHETTDPHESIRRIEAGTGLKRPSPTPPTSPAALSYRVIARVLASMVNEKDPWDVRNEQLDSSISEGKPRGYVAGFPRAAELAKVPHPGDVWAPGYQYWALLRAEQPVAILDTSGRVFLPDKQYDLNQLYKQGGRSITELIHRTLGEVLP